LLAGASGQTDFDLAQTTPVYSNATPKQGDRGEYLQGSGIISVLDPNTSNVFIVYTAEELADVSGGVAMVQSEAAIHAVFGTVRGGLQLPGLPVTKAPATRTSKGLQKRPNGKFCRLK
jgi:hypothetical protein